MGAPLTYRRDFGWRSHTLFGALGLRPAVAQHSPAEGQVLQRHAKSARCVVEIGVAEGGSAWEVRQVIPEDASLVLIDPYPKRFGLNLSIVTAHRLVSRVARGRVEWIRRRSDEAVRGWGRPIDFLFIDGDHEYDAVRRDWEKWSPHVSSDGAVAFHDALTNASWMDPSFGSARFVAELREREGAWRLVDQADSLAVFRRAEAHAGARL